MSFTEEQLRATWKQCSRHRAAIERSTKCGCFSCETVFDSREILEWISEPDNARLGLVAEHACTAICPHCGIDAVLPGVEVELSAPLLSAMNKRYFLVDRELGENVSIGPAGPG